MAVDCTGPGDLFFQYRGRRILVAWLYLSPTGTRFWAIYLAGARSAVGGFPRFQMVGRAGPDPGLLDCILQRPKVQEQLARLDWACTDQLHDDSPGDRSSSWPVLNHETPCKGFVDVFQAFARFVLCPLINFFFISIVYNQIHVLANMVQNFLTTLWVYSASFCNFVGCLHPQYASYGRAAS